MTHCWFLLLLVDRPEFLFDLLCYYKLYPISRSSSLLYLTGANHNYRTQCWRLHRWEQHLAAVIDEMLPAWNARFHPSNALPHVFDEMVTGCIDTFPIEIMRPSDGTQSQYYNGKYKKHIVKVVINKTQQDTTSLLTGTIFVNKTLCLVVSC